MISFEQQVAIVRDIANAILESGTVKTQEVSKVPYRGADGKVHYMDRISYSSYQIGVNAFNTISDFVVKLYSEHYSAAKGAHGSLIALAHAFSVSEHSKAEFYDRTAAGNDIGLLYAALQSALNNEAFQPGPLAIPISIFSGRTTVQLQSIARHYWLSSALCSRIKEYITDFIATEEEERFSFLGSYQDQSNLNDALFKLFPTSTEAFVSKSATGWAIGSVNLNLINFHNQHTAIGAVSTNPDSVDKIIEQIKWAPDRGIKKIGIVFDGYNNPLDNNKFTEVFREVTNQLAESRYQDFPHVNCSIKAACEGGKDSLEAQNLRAFLLSCEIKPENPHSDYFGPMLPGHVILKHIARLERSAIAAGVLTPWGKAIKEGFIEVLCCMTKELQILRLPSELQDLLLNWYLSSAAEHPFAANGCHYPLLIAIEGGENAMLKISQEWSCALAAKEPITH